MAYLVPERRFLNYARALQAMQSFEAWYEKENGVAPAKFRDDPYAVPLFKAPAIERLWISWVSGFSVRNQYT